MEYARPKQGTEKQLKIKTLPNTPQDIVVSVSISALARDLTICKDVDRLELMARTLEESYVQVPGIQAFCGDSSTLTGACQPSCDKAGTCSHFIARGPRADAFHMSPAPIAWNCCVAA